MMTPQAANDELRILNYELRDKRRWRDSAKPQSGGD